MTKVKFPKAALVDIDHTISDASWRDSMLDGADKWNGWDAYHAASIEDPPITAIINLVNAMTAGGIYVAGITVRPAKWRKLTNEWFLKNSVFLPEVLMRPDDDFHQAPELKVKLAMERFPNLSEEVGLIIDDREDVCIAFRNLGVTALQVMPYNRGEIR